MKIRKRVGKCGGKNGVGVVLLCKLALSFLELMTENLGLGIFWDWCYRNDIDIEHNNLFISSWIIHCKDPNISLLSTQFKLHQVHLADFSEPVEGCCGGAFEFDGFQLGVPWCSYVKVWWWRRTDFGDKVVGFLWMF